MAGVVTTSLGCQTALEDIITLTDVHPATSFKPKDPSEQDDIKDGRHVEFYFELPTMASTNNGILRPVPLSALYKGTTNIAQNNALHDPRVIKGECEVSYWIEAKFHRGGKLVGFIHRPIQVQSLYPSLRASFVKGKPLTIRAKPDLLTRCRLQKSPDLSVTISDAPMPFETDRETRKRHITLPLAIAMDASDSAPLNPRQSLNCTVEAKWHVTTRFSALAQRKSLDRLKADELIQKSATASTQKSSIIFRPLPQYDQEDSQRTKGKAREPFMATAQLELSIPETVSQPTLDWRYLTRTYALSLVLNFRGTHSAPNYSLHATVPLLVSAYGSKADDAACDRNSVDCFAAGAEVDDDDSLLRVLEPLSLAQEPSRRNPQRPTRTPPPPYFR
jgi:hypothetical protein